MNAIIVDDEKHCREVLALLLQKHCPKVTIQAVCSDAAAALKELSARQPDVLFLDIEMPDMNGFELLEKISEPNFEIIFTTAYNEYAIKAIKHSALDYLLKHVDKDELILSIKKAQKTKSKKSDARVETLLEMLHGKKSLRRFGVSTLEGLIMVNIDDIIFCESDSAYCKLFFREQLKPMVITKTLKEVEEVLQGNDFCRIHHSYVINMKFVERYIRGEGGEVVMMNGAHLPISRTRKQDFLNLFEKI
jgi:two-component system, LytTR family, response regulator